MWYENIDNLYFIGAIVAALVISGVLVYKGKKEQAKKIILALVVDAEQKFGSGTGSMKYAYVIGFVYPKLPLAVKMFISEATLESMIETAVKLLKKELAPSVSVCDSPIQAETPAHATVTVTPVVTYTAPDGTELVPKDTVAIQ